VEVNLILFSPQFILINNHIRHQMFIAALQAITTCSSF